MISCHAKTFVVCFVQYSFLTNAALLVSELSESHTCLFNDNVAHVSNIHDSQKLVLEEGESWCSENNSENMQHQADCEAIITKEIESSLTVSAVAVKDVCNMLEIRADEDSDVSS